ncbi:MAG: cysteine-rich CWC family protein [Halioglobus sp.]|nr:cysteine-rich CWC family protein [Halioglobus sp.]
MSDSRETAATCPLCGGDNQCAIAAGRSGTNCWCQTATISAEARAKAADSADRQCICRACGQPTGELKDAG